MSGNAEGGAGGGDDQSEHVLEEAADTAILACGGDVREAVKALLVANAYLEDQLNKVSYGYDRGRTRTRQAG